MAEFPALPLFTDAIIADCSHLTDAEFGLYMRLLMLIWRSPNCQIPHNTDWIARKIQRPFSEIDPLINEFCHVTLNYITQKRLQKEMVYLRERSKKQSERAKNRWNNDNESCRGNAAPHQSGNAPTPTPTPNITPIVPKGDFDGFYANYPKRVAPKDAHKSYLKAIKAATHEEIMNGLESYKKSVASTERQYIQAPAAWLNKERWKDEYDLSKQGKPERKGVRTIGGRNEQ